MGPMCLPVYDIMEELQDEYTDVEFRDMLFDSPEATVIRNLPECRSFYGVFLLIFITKMVK